MWWLIVPAGIAALTILNALNNEAGRQRKNWQEKHEEIVRLIQAHEEELRDHLQSACAAYNFNALIELHYSSFKVANQAYSLLEDARTSLGAITISIINARQQSDKLQAALRSASSGTRKSEIREEINGLSDLLNDLKRDENQINSERKFMLSEVKRLNIQTAQLKELIRDNCGPKGREWYDRLEERKRRRW